MSREVVRRANEPGVGSSQIVQITCGNVVRRRRKSKTSHSPLRPRRTPTNKMRGWLNALPTCGHERAEVTMVKHLRLLFAWTCAVVAFTIARVASADGGEGSIIVVDVAPAAS